MRITGTGQERRRPNLNAGRLIPRLHLPQNLRDQLRTLYAGSDNFITTRLIFLLVLFLMSPELC
jgi:hypothetical protein